MQTIIPSKLHPRQAHCLIRSLLVDDRLDCVVNVKLQAQRVIICLLMSRSTSIRHPSYKFRLVSRMNLIRSVVQSLIRFRVHFLRRGLQTWPVLKYGGTDGQVLFLTYSSILCYAMGHVVQIENSFLPCFYPVNTDLIPIFRFFLSIYWYAYVLCCWRQEIELIARKCIIERERERERERNCRDMFFTTASECYNIWRYWWLCGVCD